jgi:uncharacterized protein
MKKLADSNVWLALAISGHRLHASAHSWFNLQPPTNEVVYCRATQQTFLRLATTAAVWSPYGEPPLTNAEAWELYESLVGDNRIAFQDEPRGLAAAWKAFAIRSTASPKLWMDAYLAAFAIAADLVMVSLDGDFKQFEKSGLKLQLLKQN